MRVEPSRVAGDDGEGSCKSVALHADYSKLDGTSKLGMQTELEAASCKKHVKMVVRRDLRCPE